MRRCRSSCTTSSPRRRPARPIRSCGWRPAASRARCGRSRAPATTRPRSAPSGARGTATAPCRATRHRLLRRRLPSQSTVARRALDRLGWPGVLNLEVDNVRLKGGLKRAEVARDAARRLGDRCPHAHPPRPHDGRPRAAAARGGGLAHWLRRAFGVPVAFFAYPAGRYDARAEAAVRAAGYDGATTTQAGIASLQRSLRPAASAGDAADDARRRRARLAHAMTGAASRPGGGQLLHRPRAAGVAEVVGRLLAVQAQDLRAARLALRARTTGLRRRRRRRRAHRRALGGRRVADARHAAPRRARGLSVAAGAHGAHAPGGEPPAPGPGGRGARRRRARGEDRRARAGRRGPAHAPRARRADRRRGHPHRGPGDAAPARCSPRCAASRCSARCATTAATPSRSPATGSAPRRRGSRAPIATPRWPSSPAATSPATARRRPPTSPPGAACRCATRAPGWRRSPPSWPARRRPRRPRRARPAPAAIPGAPAARLRPLPAGLEGPRVRRPRPPRQARSSRRRDAARDGDRRRAAPSAPGARAGGEVKLEPLRARGRRGEGRAARPTPTTSPASFKGPDARPIPW